MKQFEISGSLKDKNGRNLSSATKKRIENINIRIVAKQLDGAKQIYQQALNNFEYKLSLPQGSYKVSLESDGRLVVTSLPKYFKINVLKNQKGLHFAVRPQTNTLARQASRTSAFAVSKAKTK